MLGKLWPSGRPSAPELRHPRDVTLTVTDVFWMANDQVGVAGVLEDGTPVRLRVGDVGPDDAWLQPARGNYVVPFSTLSLQLGDAPPESRPPFTEDRQAAAAGHRVLRELDYPEIAAFLEATCAPSVREIFAADIHVDSGGGKDWYVAYGEGARSLGTVQATEIQSVTARRNRDEGFWEFRLSFQDASGESYKLPIGDLTSHGYFSFLGESGYTPQEVGRMVRNTLRRERALYLRLGLSRPSALHPDRCYLQVAGMIAIPDPSGPPARGAWGRGRAAGRVWRV
ncbi:MAG: hypothetical protein KC442_18200 [Thermomicrobiales bacterium]|nr:hypothetical protein [Thermomicrobiales bacterium]